MEIDTNRVRNAFQDGSINRKLALRLGAAVQEQKRRREAASTPVEFSKPIEKPMEKPVKKPVEVQKPDKEPKLGRDRVSMRRIAWGLQARNLEQVRRIAMHRLDLYA